MDQNRSRMPALYLILALLHPILDALFLRLTFVRPASVIA
jgi:hypothetical protein